MTGRLRALAPLKPGLWSCFWQSLISQECRQSHWTGTIFSEMIGLVGELSDADAAATLTAMCAAGVAQGMEHCPQKPGRVLVTGGGRHNPLLMEMLAVSLDCPVAPVEAVGLDGDMLEAQAFAHLAVRVARGMPTSCPGTTGVRAAVGGGIVSVPS